MLTSFYIVQLIWCIHHFIVLFTPIHMCEIMDRAFNETIEIIQKLWIKNPKGNFFK